MASCFMEWGPLTQFITDAFEGCGIPHEDAAICTDILLESDRRGIESHGVNRFKPIYIDRIKAGIQFPVTQFEVLKETPTTAVVDGHHGMGQVIGYRAMSMAIAKAKEYGMGMVAVRNSTHYGIAGYYATMATKDVYKRQPSRRRSWPKLWRRPPPGCPACWPPSAVDGSWWTGCPVPL